MRRVISTLLIALVLPLAFRAADVRGQASCSFVRGFATLRELIGEQKVGACLEDERFNDENGNAEQRTTGGLLVWRKADNFTAFTDGATTWVNGPHGLQSRPNDERFSWESDPEPSTRVAAAGSGDGANGTGPADGGAAAAAANAAATSAAQSTPTRVPTATATPTPRATPTPAATATPARTPTPTPNPVEARFSEKPDDAHTGSQVEFVVRTNAKKGTCGLVVTYRNSDPLGIGGVEIDDGRCEWRYIIAENAKTGKAKAEVIITAENGTVTIDDDFTVKKGDEIHSGNVNLQAELKKLPDEAKVGEEIEIEVETELKNRGSCELTITWPQIGATTADSKKPNGSGRCNWKITVPTTITKKGDASVLIVVRRDSTYRTITKEMEVRLP